MIEGRWFQDRRAWRLILCGYLPWFAGLNLAWEAAHARLYTLWVEREVLHIAFSVLHCTLGDVLIGTAALFTALIAGREGLLTRWRWSRIVMLATLAGLAYTMLSEWMNVAWLRSWAYAESMPRLELAGFEFGLTPLAQWLVMPPLALYLARRTRR